MAQYPAVIDLASLDGYNGFTFHGASPGGYSQWTVASAGDFNGDGFDDLVIAVQGTSPPYGPVNYVVFGSATGFPADVELNGAGAIKLTNAGPIASIASAGDVNGDGIDDLVLGDLGGHAYVVFGRPTGESLGPDIDLTTLNGNNGFVLTGGGYGAVAAGDVNGDGFSDVVLGTPGAVYVMFGKASGFAAQTHGSDLTGSTGFKITDSAATGAFGRYVSTADVNGDGYADVVVSAYGASPSGAHSGETYVVFGKASGFGSGLDVASLNGTNGFAISGAAAGDGAGRGVSTAGDVNGDGYADLIVGAAGADPHGSSSGASYVVFGKASGFAANIDLSTLDGSNGFKISGVAANDHSGISVSSAGDVNGDGFNDLIVGTYGVADASYVIFGKASGFAANIDLSTLDGTNGFKINGVGAGVGVGTSVSSAGDINGDGLADLFIGTNASNNAFVVYSQLPDTAVNRVGTDASQSLVGGDFSDTLSGLGGNDRLFGNGGDDTITGGTGNDTVSGGLGADTFVLSGPQAHYTVTPDGSGGYIVVDHVGTDGADHLTGVETLQFSDGQLALTSNGQVGGTPGADTLNGTGGADQIYGLGGADAINGLGGADMLFGGAGDDTITGGAGNDAVDGGAGRDIFVVSGPQANYAISTADGLVFTLSDGVGTDGTDHLTGIEAIQFSDGLVELARNISLTNADNSYTAGYDREFIYGLGGDDNLTGGKGNDAIYGGDGDDRITAGDGNNALYGDAGDDSFTVNLTLGGVVRHTVYAIDGGSGFDRASFNFQYFSDDITFVLDQTPGAISTFLGQGSTVTNVESVGITGGSGDDSLTGGSNSDFLFGNTGDDILNGGGGPDNIAGGAGIDTADYHDSPAGVTIALGLSNTLSDSPAIGSGGDAQGDHIQQVENLSGSAFADKLTGDKGANVLIGNGGDDTLKGLAGDDTLYGGAGDDKLDGQTGADQMYGGGGNDTFTVDNAGDQVFENAGEGTDKVKSSVSFELGPNIEKLALTGTAAIDGTGNELANAMVGNAAANVLSGLAGADSLSGNAGDDTLIGGTGKDILTGGAGADTFVFGPAAAADADKLTDFAHGTDHLAFHAGDYGLPAGALDSSNLVFGTHATDAHHEFVYDATHKSLLWDSDGAGGAAAIQVASFSTAATLTASDFIILA